MVYLRFKIDGRIKYGILSGKVISEITPDYFSPHKKTGRKYALSKAQLLAPSEPGKVIALGLNYIEHARELKMALPMNPLIFLKAPTSVIGPGDLIERPAQSARVDYEAEMAIVIGRKCRNVSVKRSLDCVLGYTCLNDVTARDLQSKDGQWTRAKSFDTFCPIGPWIVTGIDPDDLSVESYLNGKLKQHSNTKNLIFKTAQIVSFVSEVMTLLPGDVIATGTPPGIGPMKNGDEIKIKIGKIGTLVNKVSGVSGK